MPDTTRTLTGYPWIVSPTDPDRPGITDRRFTAEGPSSDILVSRPLSEQDRGITNRPAGRAFLVITESTSPPIVQEGWRVIPADLSPDFRVEGDEVRLRRVLGSVAVAAPGTDQNNARVQECEFDVRG